MLSGRTVLIVEAQYLIALDLQNTLDQLGPGKVVIAQNATHARELSEEWQTCGLAIVEVERNLPEQIAFARELARSGIPVIGLTADSDLQQHLNWSARMPILLKPASTERTLELVATLFEPQNE